MKQITVFLKNNKIMIMLFAVFAAINAIALLRMPERLLYSESRSFFIVIVMLETVLLAVMFVITNRIIHKKKSYEKIFLSVILPIGLLFLFLIPIGSVPDEAVHFYRAYEVSLGHLSSDVNEEGIAGRDLPLDTVLLFDRTEGTSNYENLLEKLALHTSDTFVFAEFPGSALYSFVPYLPQAIGIFVGRILGLPTLLIAYLGRLGNFIFFLLGIYYSVKLIPYKKLSFMMLCLTPMMIQQSISLSADVMTITLSVMFVSYILHLSRRTDCFLKFREYIFLVLLSIGIALCKIVYFPLCLLMFLIPPEQFAFVKKWFTLFLIIGISVLLNLWWSSVASSYFIEFREGVNVAMQFDWIWNHPFAYIAAFCSTIGHQFFYYLFGSVGQALCLYDVILSWKYLAIYIVLTAVAVASEPKAIDRLSHKFLIIASVMLIILLIFTGLYLQWNPVGAAMIEGIQGRYFIPLLFLIAAIFGKKRVLSNYDNLKYFLAIAVSLNLYAAGTIFMTYVR